MAPSTGAPPPKGVDLLQGSRGVFGIAVYGAMRELTGTIADFPANAPTVANRSRARGRLAARRRARKTGFVTGQTWTPAPLPRESVVVAGGRRRSKYLSVKSSQAHGPPG